jgi:hypothetical protein
MRHSSIDASSSLNSVSGSNEDSNNNPPLQVPVTLHLPAWLHRRRSGTSPTSISSSGGMNTRIAQLRNAFGLDDSEELYGQFSCAHTRPRWGAQFLQVGSCGLN